ncbi:hypothetical protein FHR94_002772 [Halomonas cerina]|uniref:Uncharacterized protein n=1 Tax=Halomonas cerina TaxID=447424 RepID=A0A839V7U2_9GAMM|nr:hypothetical protein [Halomonas cerina]
MPFAIVLTGVALPLSARSGDTAFATGSRVCAFRDAVGRSA